MLASVNTDSRDFFTAAARGGYSTISFALWSSGKVEVTDMEPFECPYEYVRDEADMIASISRMRDNHISKFVLLLGRKLYTALQNDPIKKDRSIFYPGYEILRAVRNGWEGRLSPRLRETLAAARKIVSGVTGSQARMVE